MDFGAVSSRRAHAPSVERDSTLPSALEQAASSRCTLAGLHQPSAPSGHATTQAGSRPPCTEVNAEVAGDLDAAASESAKLRPHRVSKLVSGRDNAGFIGSHLAPEVLLNKRQQGTSSPAEDVFDMLRRALRAACGNRQ